MNLFAHEDAEFINFIAKYGKTYASKSEHQRRAQIFAQNLQYINEHNAKADKTYTLAVNKFADMLEEEFKKKRILESPVNQEFSLKQNL